MSALKQFLWLKCDNFDTVLTSASKIQDNTYGLWPQLPTCLSPTTKKGQRE